MQMPRFNSFLILTLILLLILAYPVFLGDKLSIHLWLNNQHNSFADFLFKYATHLGDGLALLTGSLILLLFSVRKALFLGISGMASGAIAQLLKKQVFDQIDRPIEHFEQGLLHLVDGVKMAHHFSFPSGHATAAFALFYGLFLIVDKPKLGPVFLILACFVAYSRVYLSQHFLIDIYFGAILGLITTLFVYQLLYKRWVKKDQLNGSLIKLLS